MIEGRHFAAAQIVGGRAAQEDGFALLNAAAPDEAGPEGLLLVLADGMGGHRGGATASALATSAFAEAFAAAGGTAPSRLSIALQKANAEIAGAAEAEGEALAGMGCTLVGVAFDADGVHWISVGDSPLWLLREGVLHRLNDDHSMAPLIAERVRRGELSAGEAARHPERAMLRSALTGEPIPLVDRSSEPLWLRRGDRLLAASDGILSLAEDDIVRHMSAATDARGAAEALVRAVDALARPSQDNTTVLVAAPPDPGLARALAQGAADAWRRLTGRAADAR